MHYRRRMALCSAVSLLLNLAVLLAPWQQQAALGHVPDAPLQLRLRAEPPPPPDPQAPRPQVIETAVAAHRPVEPTHLLSDRNANAADAQLHDGAALGPRLDEQGDLVSMPVAPSRSQEGSPLPPRTRQTRAAEEEEPAGEPMETAQQEAVESAALLEALDAAERPDEDRDRAEAPEQQPLLAQALPFPGGETPQRGRGQMDGKILERGFTSFEALQDDVAAYYLHHVKPLIRRSWIAAMLTRYTGSTRAVAEVEVAIAPDGRVVSATNVGTPTNRIYAALCRESVVKAGPFKPFPFQVPPEYRDENLVIHCTFQWQ